MVDAVIREWLRSQLGAEVAHLGLGNQIRTLLAVFYADNGLVQSRDPVFLQEAFNALVALFECVGLRTHTKKAEGMACIPGRIRTSLLCEAYANRIEGFHNAWVGTKNEYYATYAVMSLPQARSGCTWSPSTVSAAPFFWIGDW